MKKNIKKTICALAMASCVTISLVGTPKVLLLANTGCTISDLGTYSVFEKELHEIRKEKKPQFVNKDLYNYFVNYFGGDFTKDDLENVSTLVIDKPLSDSNLSDLKYMPNLTSLEIHEMKIDANDLRYNQNLLRFNMVLGEISNSSKLPNTLSSFTLDGTVISEDILYVPYNVENLNIWNAIFSRIVFKNPESLLKFNFCGYSLLDLNDLKDCFNLEYMELRRCPNVKNIEVLNDLSSLSSLELDEFCCIWLNGNLLSKLPLSPDSKVYYMDLINELDIIVTDIINEGMSEEEKLNAIILYVVNYIDYDPDVSFEVEGHENLVNEYNKHPIYYALKSDVGICVNYGCLFKALADRVGLDNYQPKSESHTWNMVRLGNQESYGAYDMSIFDGFAYLRDLNGDKYCSYILYSNYLENNDTSQLCYYGFDVEQVGKDTYKTLIEPKDIKNITKEIGYLNANIFDSKLVTSFVVLGEILAFISIAIGNSVYQTRKENSNVQVLKYKRVGEDIKVYYG